MLRFALGPIPVRIHWSALVLALFAWNGGFQGVEIAVFTGVAILSVLIHELGHAVAARSFKGEAMVTLYALGGVTRMVPTKPFSNGQGFIISATGSAVEIVAGMVVWLAARQGLLGAAAEVSASGSFGAMIGLAIGLGDLLALGVAVFIWVSVVWGIFNWVPIRGLDGHHMLARILDATLPPNPLRSPSGSSRSWSDWGWRFGRGSPDSVSWRSSCCCSPSPTSSPERSDRWPVGAERPDDGSRYGLGSWAMSAARWSGVEE